MKRSESQDVAEFYALTGQMVHGEPGHLAWRKLDERYRFLKEELQEFGRACAMQDLPEIADALVDLVYVIKGTALMLGLPWERLWDEVHAANMRKLPGDKNGRMRRDAIKPPGWQPPNLLAILVEHGYDEQVARRRENHRDDVIEPVADPTFGDGHAK